MRYLREHLETIAGVDIYPLISMLIFFFFFIALTFYVIKMKGTHIDYMKSRPLEEDSATDEFNPS